MFAGFYLPIQNKVKSKKSEVKILSHGYESRFIRLRTYDSYFPGDGNSLLHFTAVMSGDFYSNQGPPAQTIGHNPNGTTYKDPITTDLGLVIWEQDVKV